LNEVVGARLHGPFWLVES